MICISGNMPVLQIGEHQVSNYDTHWIRLAIENAAFRANQPYFSFVDDVYDGIVYYLEHKCSLRLLEIEALYMRIRHTLKRIGCEAIANELVMECPPITISLERAAIEAGNGYELAFYQILQSEMLTLKKLGVREVFFSELNESILILKQSKGWQSDCDQLENDILLWLKNAGTRPQRQGIRIRCNIEKVKA